MIVEDIIWFVLSCSCAELLFLPSDVVVAVVSPAPDLSVLIPVEIVSCSDIEIGMYIDDGSMIAAGVVSEGLAP